MVMRPFMSVGSLSPARTISTAISQAASTPMIKKKNHGMQKSASIHFAWQCFSKSHQIRMIYWWL
jgi:hypothetical protein